MAKQRKKSYNDIKRQFDRIWTSAVENSDVYKSLQQRYPGESEKEGNFQGADRQLRNGGNRLSEKDQRLNARIGRADKIATRYLEGLRKGSGFSESTPFYERNSERLNAYRKWTDKKYSYARRAGISG